MGVFAQTSIRGSQIIYKRALYNRFQYKMQIFRYEMHVMPQTATSGTGLFQPAAKIKKNFKYAHGNKRAVKGLEINIS